MGHDDRIQKLTMPKWGFSMTQGKVVDWLVAEGSEISRGAEVLEVETEKSIGIVESPVGGVLRRHVATFGQDIPVGGLVGVIADASVSDAEIDEFVKSFVLEETAGKTDSQQDKPAYAAIGGRSLRYLKQGEGGEPVVLIHGFAGNLNNWLFNHSALAGDRAVYAIDLPGHGQSSKDIGEGSIEFFANVVREWMDALGIERAHLVGHSMGGAIAMATALSAPQRILSCTLISSAGLGNEIDAEYVRGVVNSDRRKELKVYLERLFANPELATRQLVDDVLKFKRIDGVQAALNQLADTFIVEGRQKTVYRDRMHEISVPLLVLWGEKDRIVPRSHTTGLPANCTVEILENCGHMVQMEASADVNRLISNFLRKLT
ncbi:MAG: acetoin dehydrogenase dihydrolipoyllysine-residue acetyltransferase subunit [Planctomycetaceae bacterium]